MICKLNSIDIISFIIVLYYTYITAKVKKKQFFKTLQAYFKKVFTSLGSPYDCFEFFSVSIFEVTFYIRNFAYLLNTFSSICFFTNLTGCPDFDKIVNM